MAREFVQVPDGIPHENRFTQQIVGTWLGLEGNGTDADLAGVPLRQTSVNDDAKYAVDARNRGAGGLHYRATHSSGSPELFEVTDAGTSVSIAGGAMSQPFVFPGMIVMWHGIAADVPDGWAICDGTNGTPDLRDRFVVGAGSTYALNATGGAATYDISHNHTQNSHNHTQDAHTHTQDAHSHSHAHDVDLDHDHADETTEAATDGASNSFETGDALTGVTQEYALKPHVHQVNIAPLGSTVVATDADATTATATNQNTTATNQATTATNNTAGSTTQSVLNPYAALYFIKRITA